MTEEEWHACKAARLMLVFLEEKSSPRKARLFTCAIGRSLWPYLGDERSRRVVEVAEYYADSEATETELHEAETAACDNSLGWASRVARCAGDRGAWQGGRVAIICLQHSQTEREGRDLAKRIESRSRRLLVCVWQPVPPSYVRSRWRTSTVLALGQGIYDDRAFDRLPILADALEDAGCDNDDILNHLRDATAPHVRGC